MEDFLAPWTDMMRNTLPGRLILGSTFNWPDLPAYAFGVTLGAFVKYRFRSTRLGMVR